MSDAGPHVSPRPRVLLKLSGEALAADGRPGYDASAASPVIDEIVATARDGVELAIVVGGGNLLRGAELSGTDVQRDVADRMGMLATLMNGLALRDLLRARGAAHGMGCTLLTGLPAPDVAPTFSRDLALAAFARGEIVVLAGGTGQPYFTTDTAAVLRALQIDAVRLLKATSVDGVYDADPRHVKDARRYDRVDFRTCIERSLRIMDQTAFALAADHGLEIVVFSMRTPGAVRAAARGDDVGTRVVATPRGA